MKSAQMDCSEVNNVLDESGYHIELREVAFSQMWLKWGKYNNQVDKVLTFHPDKNSVISHFRMADPAERHQYGIAEGQFVLYQEKAEPYDLHISPTKEKWCNFFEAGMPDTVFCELFGEDGFLGRFNNHTPSKIPSLEFTATILPKMHAIIHDMSHTAFQGHLRGLFLETKTIELFLLQIEQLGRPEVAAYTNLKKQDIESLHAIKEYLELNFDQPTSIAALSRRVGINSMKLKTGFRQLFNTTVFGYLQSIRMQEARRLLLEENLPVNEVAYRIGYKHPHHFAAAFRRQFDIMPSQLRNHGRP